MGLVPTVLVLAGDDAAQRVAAAGYTVVRSGTEAGDRAPDAVVIEARGAHARDAAAQAASVRTMFGLGVAPVLAYTGEDGGEWLDGAAFDGVIADGAAAPQTASRLQSALRMAVMRDEATLRVATLVRFGARLDTEMPAPSHPMSILILGAPGTALLALSSSLEARGAETVSAFSSFSAFDYLHLRAFDAVVVSGLDDPDAGMGFCSALRRNARLFHLPAALIVPPGFEAMDEAFNRGASDVVEGGSRVEPIADRLIGLAAEKRRRDGLHAAFKAARVPDAVDPATGLYNRAFFAGHLAAQVARAHDTGRPMAVAAIAVADDETTQALLRARALQSVLSQAGSMIGRLVRAEDMAARLDQGVFAVAFPGCGKGAAFRAVDRINAVLSCTAFNTGSAIEGPLTLAFSVAAAELNAGETAPRLLARALARFTAGGPVP